MTRALRLLGLSLTLAVFAVLAACAGNEGNASGRPPRGDWRHQAAVCTNDDQCGGGACVIADGATRGTCQGGADPSLPPGHPPRRPQGPNGPSEEPTVKPQPGDIQL